MMEFHHRRRHHNHHHHHHHHHPPPPPPFLSFPFLSLRFISHHVRVIVDGGGFKAGEDFRVRSE